MRPRTYLCFSHPALPRASHYNTSGSNVKSRFRRLSANLQMYAMQLTFTLDSMPEVRLHYGDRLLCRLNARPAQYPETVKVIEHIPSRRSQSVRISPGTDLLMQFGRRTDEIMQTVREVSDMDWGDALHAAPCFRYFLIGASADLAASCIYVSVVVARGWSLLRLTFFVRLCLSLARLPCQRRC